MRIPRHPYSRDVAQSVMNVLGLALLGGEDAPERAWIAADAAEIAAVGAVGCVSLDTTFQHDGLPPGNRVGKGAHMVVFIDESGDPGMKLDAGASLFFVVTAVAFQSEDDALACTEKIDELREAAGLPSH